MKKNLLLLMLALLLPAFMYGQEQTVSGTVLDTYKMGVPGASIVEKGTTNGTITDSTVITLSPYPTKTPH